MCCRSLYDVQRLEVIGKSSNTAAIRLRRARVGKLCAQTWRLVFGATAGRTPRALQGRRGGQQAWHTMPEGMIAH